jgi:TolA-binding protein
MAKGRISAGLALGGVLLCGSGTAAWAGPVTVPMLLSFQPKQADIHISTPKPEEQAQCKIEVIRPQPNTSAYVLRDPQGRLLRRLMDTNGDGRVDTYCYYLDGVEVYRESQSHFDTHIDQFRWLNTAGMKWGYCDPADPQHRIIGWKMMSAQEAAQEIFQAVVNNDFNRLKALWLTDADMKLLGLPAGEIARIHTVQERAASKFQDTVTKLALGDKAHFLRLEAPPAQCQPADSIGSAGDIIRQKRGSIMYDNNGKTDFFQTGEMIQVGQAWKLVDAPSVSDVGETSSDPNVTELDPKLKALVEKLHQIDEAAMQAQASTATNDQIVQYNTARATVLQDIVVSVKPDQKEQWIRQLADSLSAVVQASTDAADKPAAYQQLVGLEKQIVQDQAGSRIAAYVTYAEIVADNAAALKKDTTGKAQEQYLNRLKQFIQDYPQGENAPDALMQLGMISEFLGKELEAKRWYTQLASSYPTASLAEKAKGALRRLGLEGKPLELSGPTLDNQTFNITSLQGKLVIVYYWASWNQQSIGDFARLKVLMDKYASKGVALVCVNLDNHPPEAEGELTRSQLPGVQLYQPGGLDSPLAKQYGIMVLPNMFLVGPDGKVISRTVQMANLEDEINKHRK